MKKVAQVIAIIACVMALTACSKYEEKAKRELEVIYHDVKITRYRGGGPLCLYDKSHIVRLGFTAVDRFGGTIDGSVCVGPGDGIVMEINNFVRQPPATSGGFH